MASAVTKTYLEIEAAADAARRGLAVSIIRGERLEVGSYQVGAFGRTPGVEIGSFRISLRAAPTLGAA